MTVLCTKILIFGQILLKYNKHPGLSETQCILSERLHKIKEAQSVERMPISDMIAFISGSDCSVCACGINACQTHHSSMLYHRV